MAHYSELSISKTTYDLLLSIFRFTKDFGMENKYKVGENLKNMKTTEKSFDAVKFIRQQLDKLSEELSEMTKEEILEYFKTRKIKAGIKPCA